MQLTIETFPFILKFGEERAYELIKEAGFTGIDFSYNATGKGLAINLDNYQEKAKKSLEMLKKLGLSCRQAHGPFEMQYTDEFSLENFNYKNVVNSILHAGIMGIERIVIHSLRCPDNVDFFEVNQRYYRSLIPYAKQANVKIAVENLVKGKLFTPEKLVEFTKGLNSDVFCVCVDVGHCAIVNIPPEEFIQVLPKGLMQCIHLHDTDLSVDKHWMPYHGEQNWEKIMKALVDYGFDGEINLEVIRPIITLPDELVFPALKYTAEIGKYLIKLFENYKKEV